LKTFFEKNGWSLEPFLSFRKDICLEVYLPKLFALW